MAGGLLDVLQDETLDAMKRKRIGLYRGEVRNVDDPDGRGRVLLQVPEVLGEHLTEWASYCSPFGGGGYGFYMLPRVGDPVWVTFESGDPQRPVWLGFWYSADDLVPGDAAKEVRVLVSKAGHKIVFDDTSNGDVTLQHASGNSLVLKANGDVEVKQKAGSKVKLGATVPASHGVVLEALLSAAWAAGWGSHVTAENTHIHSGGTIPPTGLTGPPVVPYVAPSLSGHASGTVEGQP